MDPGFFFFKYLFLFIYLAVLSLSCSIWDVVPQPGNELRPPALGAWSLSHWTTKKVPAYFLKACAGEAVAELG